MIDYVLIFAFVATVYLLLQNRYLKAKKWFVILNIVLTIGIITYLVIDSSKPWNIRKVVLLILVAGSVLHTLIRRAFGLFQRK